MPNQLFLTTFRVLFLLLIFIISFVQNSIAQVYKDKNITVRTMDFRGHDPDAVMLKSVRATNNDMVVVLVRGGDEDLIEKTKGHMGALISAGYTRIGLSLSDQPKNVSGPIIYVFANGTLHGVIRKAKTTALGGEKLYEFVREAYKKHVTPKINSSTSSG